MGEGQATVVSARAGNNYYLGLSVLGFEDRNPFYTSF